MSHTPIHRRHLLRGIGAIAVGLPLLEIMDGLDENGLPLTGVRRARAASAPIKRYIGLMVPNGIVPSTHFPTGGETDFVLGASMKPLNGFNLPSFEDYRQDLIVFKGIDNVASMNSFGTPGSGSGHESGPTTLFTGAAKLGTKEGRDTWKGGGPSIDQLIAEQIEKDHGAPFPIKSLLLGHTNGADWFGSISFDANGTYLPSSGSTSNTFDTLFGSGNLTDAERQAIRDRRKSVLDGTLENFQRLYLKASVADKVRLKEHMDAIRDVEMRVDAQITCTRPDKTKYMDLDPGNGDGKNLPVWSNLMFDLMTLGFACDMTRVATFVFRNCGGGGSYLPFLGWADGTGLNGSAYDAAYATGEHHEMSHRVGQAEWDPELTKASAFFNGSTALLAQKMKAVTEGSGTLFDSALMLQSSEIGTGGHNNDNSPFVILGNAAGSIRTGRYLNYTRSVPHNDLLLGVMAAMGLSATTVGDAGLCSGPLKELI